MCDFKPGDEVVCVDDSVSGGGFWNRNRFPLVKGAVYRVSSVVSEEQHALATRSSHPSVTWITRPGPHLYLTGVVNPTGGGFFSGRFRKVQKRNSSLSIESFLTIKPGFEEPRRVTPKQPVKA